MARTLLKHPTPTALTCLPVDTQEIINRNVNISILTHELGVIGYDVRTNSVIKKK